MPRKGRRLLTRKPAWPKPQVERGRILLETQLAHHRLTALMHVHLEWLAATGHSADTLRVRRGAILRFIGWCEERALTEPTEITHPVLERYQRHLYYYRSEAGRPLSLGAQATYLAPLKSFFRWLAREHHILYNPAAELELPRQPKRLPRAILSVEEVAWLLVQADPATAQGLRDRAMLEMLYSTGLRRAELAALAVYDIDLAHGLVRVREGKGGRERVVPLGERAGLWLERYLAEARPQLLVGESTALFVSDYGEPLRPDQVTTKVRRYLEAAGLEHKAGAAHLLRHACATHMLEGGADIRFIQALLGHAKLETTEVYTHVSIDKLKAIHAATHPARLERAPEETPKASASKDRRD